ncbi:NAD(P)-dependent oxidoreductase [Falsiroseomonas selenitidurans]|uniref:3-phosphoglycerate dehydrogenase n=1 Tax=Falsiroseomonas selenitidurans TaxID=2716335 RepID=A0ABX1DXL3_9PROT|nr:2-hydroxyacid dehydrogenase [Falsiroseomonas selenitidurans]NKC29645.1 3-phosphoglycerate dehydrogenase [Falsiroseomonas selenitidurans]
MTQKIALLQPIAGEMADIIQSCLPEGFSATAVTGRSVEDLKAAVADADYALWWDIGVPAEVLAAGPKLKLLHKWGVGIDNIDLDYCRAHGIQVARTTGSNAAPVAEFTIGLMLAIARCIVPAHNSTAAGGWAKNEIWKRSVMLTGKTVGIIGLGAIGKGVAKRLQGFDCRVLYYSRTRLPEAEAKALGVEYCALDDLLGEVDFLSLNCPLTPETKGMIDARALARMKPTASLVNVARGGVVVEADLVEALKTGRLRAAAVDVFDQEPPPADHPLLHMDNVIVSPHCASTAYENSRRSVMHWLGNMVRVSKGEPIPEQDRVV